MHKFYISLLFSLTTYLLTAQNAGQLSGRILDKQTQLPIEGVTLILEGSTMGVVTDEGGYFNFKDVPTQSYNLIVSHLGYQSKTVFNIIVKAFGTPPLQILLEESSNELEEVVIFQSPFRTSVETPLSTQTFSAVEIETYPGGNNDITKVIQSMPGISPSIGGFRNDIIIRGGAPNESVYYLDGIEIPNINHFSTQGSAGGPIGMLNVSFIREVTLSSSAFGAEYDNPLSGVLSFEQREGNPNRFGGNFRFGASEAALTLEGPLFRKNKEIPAKTTMLFSVRRSYLQFVFELIGLPLRPDYWDYQWKINHEIDAYNTLIFLGLGTIDDFSVEPPDDFNADQQTTIEQAPIIEQKTITLGLSWKRKYKNGKGSMITSLSTNRLQNIFSRYRDNVQKTGLIFENDSYEQETKLRYLTQHYLDQWKVSAGSNIQYSDYGNDTQRVLDNFEYSTKIDFVKYGFFAKAERKFFEDNLGLSFGFRLDADSYSEGSSLMDNFSPRMALTYNLTEDQTWKINASAGRYYKIPTYTMLGYQNNQGMFFNKSAQYTQSDHLVMGLEYAPGNASRITLEGFYKKYSQYPVSMIDGVSLANKGGDFEVLGNEAINSNGKGRSYGLEALYQQKLSNNFYGIFAYTYFHSQFTTLTGNYLPSVWDSRHLISFSGGYKLKRNWEISARWRFSGRTPYIPVDENASIQTYPELILDYDQLGNVKLDPFSLADIRFDKKWNFKRYSFNFYFEVQNFLMQTIPRPDEFGLNRSSDGNIIIPKSLVKLKTENRTNLPIPSFGFVIDF
jgi:outer membrane receptor for ferrienterochelin and colicin